jgi:hypothetical protein
MTHQTLPLAIWAISMIVVVLGTIVSGSFVVVSIRRAIILHRPSDGDPISRITLRRTIRNETCFLGCQLLVLFATVWSIGSAMPQLPKSAIAYYFIASCCRMGISLWLAASAILDYRDRIWIHRIRNEQQARLFREAEEKL